jgi:hypothetical protein
MLTSSVTRKSRDPIVLFLTNFEIVLASKLLQKPYRGPANLRLPAWQPLHIPLTVLLVACSRRLTIYHGFKYMVLVMKCLTTVCYMTLRYGVMLTSLINSSGTCATGLYADDATASCLLHLSVTDKRFWVARRKQEITKFWELIFSGVRTLGFHCT